MNISSSADVQLKRRFNVDIANCNNMRKRMTRFKNEDGYIWFDVPKGNKDVLINMNLIVADEKFLLGQGTIQSNCIKGTGLTLRVDQTRVGTKYTYSFTSWKAFEALISRLPSYMPSGYIHHIADGDGEPVEFDQFLRHINHGTDKITSFRTSRSQLRGLRRHMRNLGIAA